MNPEDKFEEEKRRYAEEVIGKQNQERLAEIDIERESGQQQKEAQRQAENSEWEEKEWASRLSQAKNTTRLGDANASPNQNAMPDKKVIDQINALNKKIQTEKKKTGYDYYLVYLFLTVTAISFDLLGLLATISTFLAWLNLIFGPVFGAIRFIGIRYTYIGIDDNKELMKTATITVVSGAVSTLGIPVRTAAMIGEFGARELMAKKAQIKISDLEKQRAKLLAPYGGRV